jgi:hypothetical protein
MQRTTTDSQEKNISSTKDKIDTNQHQTLLINKHIYIYIDEHVTYKDQVRRMYELIPVQQ